MQRNVLNVTFYNKFYDHESSEKSDDEDHLSNDVHVNDDEEDSDNSYELIEYQCHICKLQLPNKDDLFDYVETDHED